MQRLLMLGLACCSLSACAMRLEARPNAPNPPPPFAPQMMGYEEAVQLGSSYAQNRAYRYRLQEAHLASGRLWKVNFRIFEQERQGKLHLEYDAFSRRLLSADERLGRRGEHDDGEHEDGEHGDDHERHRGRGGERNDD